MRTITKEELSQILDKHQAWINGEDGGERADLRGADLRWANLRGADLRWANLRGADLRWAILSGANLSWANLSGANLSWANLSGAILTEADLTEADLTGADLTGANLTGISLKFDTKIYCIKGKSIYQCSGIGEHRRALTLIAEGEEHEWRWFAGCFSGTKQELLAAVREKYGDNTQGYALAIEFLESLAFEQRQQTKPIENTNMSNETEETPAMDDITTMLLNYRKQFLETSANWEFEGINEITANAETTAEELHDAVIRYKRMCQSEPQKDRCLSQVYNKLADMIILLNYIEDFDLKATLKKRIECNLDRLARAKVAAEAKGTAIGDEWPTTERHISE